MAPPAQETLPIDTYESFVPEQQTLQENAQTPPTKGHLQMSTTNLANLNREMGEVISELDWEKLEMHKCTGDCQNVSTSDRNPLYKQKLLRRRIKRQKMRKMAEAKSKQQEEPKKMTKKMTKKR